MHSDGRREQIVETAGVNVATLHCHSRDKEEILLNVLDGLASSYHALLPTRETP
jgi:AcrR family transcriptional regulator